MPPSSSTNSRQLIRLNPLKVTSFYLNTLSINKIRFELTNFAQLLHSKPIFTRKNQRKMIFIFGAKFIHFFCLQPV